MQPIYKTYTTVGAQEPIGVSWMSSYPIVVVGVAIARGSATYGVQFTLDPIDDATITPRWFDVPGLITGTSTSGYASITWPICGVRFVGTVVAGSVEFKLIQPE